MYLFSYPGASNAKADSSDKSVSSRLRVCHCERTTTVALRITMMIMMVIVMMMTIVMVVMIITSKPLLWNVKTKQQDYFSQGSTYLTATLKALQLDKALVSAADE